MLSLVHSYIFLFTLSLLSNVRVNAVTVYTSIPLTGYAPSPAATAVCISASACDGSTLNALPNPQPGSQGIVTSVTPNLSGSLAGLGPAVNGDFQGFSIELSVANQVLGNDGSKVNPIFLNLMQNIAVRAGRVLCRVGGNSQESATVVPGGLPNDTAIVKTNTTNFTPTLFISPSLIYAMGNASNFVNIDWFIGVPFNDTVNYRPELAQIAQAILGSHLVGMQLGNEPDLYTINQSRNSSYTPANYVSEWGTVVNLYKNNPLVPKSNIFVGPSICCGGPGQPGWIPEQVWDANFLTDFQDDLSYVSVQHYPTNNCNDTGPLDPNQLLPVFFLNHSAVVALSQPYVNSTGLSRGINKPFIMFETNTASCGGFSALSDSFAAALWSLDYNLNMAVNGFANAMYHIGGQRAYYNPFTPPPTNQTKFRQWTIGPTYYTALVTAEAFGRSGNAQVADLGLGNSNPGYGIVEKGVLERVVLFNFLTDPTGALNYTAYLGIGGNQTGQPQTTPSSVQVKYFLAPSVSEKWNITWAGQTFGGPYATDGRPTGNEVVYNIACDTTNNFCPVTVPAPGVAVVFFSGAALQAGEPTTTQTFATTVTATVRNTASIDPTQLAVSNGHGGQNILGLGSTSLGTNKNGAGALKASMTVVGVSVFTALAISMRLLTFH